MLKVLQDHGYQWQWLADSILVTQLTRIHFEFFFYQFLFFIIILNYKESGFRVDESSELVLNEEMNQVQSSFESISEMEMLADAGKGVGTIKSWILRLVHGRG